MGQKQSKRGEGSSLKSASCGSRRDDDRTTSCSSETLRGVLQSLHRAGLKGTCKVSVAIGFGATNRESGRKTFPKLRSLHSVHPRCKRLTPYEEVIVCLSRSLEALARPNEVAAYGFGDERSDESPPQVFPFLKASRPLEDFDELHRRYRFIAQHVRLGQTSSITPAIRNAIDETAAGGLQFHVLVIVADALHSNPSQDSASSARKVKESSSVSLLRQFSSKKHKLGSDPSSGRSRYSSCGSISPKFIEEAVTESRREEEIERAIVEASRYPISIIFVGVGDGGREFREAKEKFARKRFPGQLFPNFSFVDYSCLTSRTENFEKRQVPLVHEVLRTVAAHHAAIQDHYQEMLELHHQRTERANSASAIGDGEPSARPGHLRQMPSELLEADKTYRKKFSPLSAHINKSPRESIATSASALSISSRSSRSEDALASIHTNMRTLWSARQASAESANLHPASSREEGNYCGDNYSPPSAPFLGESMNGADEGDWDGSEMLQRQNAFRKGPGFSMGSPTSPSGRFRGRNLNLALNSWRKLILRKETAPPIYLCPITQEIMEDPVICEDGYTYEREAIQKWTRTSPRSPMTNVIMRDPTRLIPNHTLRSAIREWQEDRKDQNQEDSVLRQRISRIREQTAESARKIRSQTANLFCYGVEGEVA